MAASYSQDLRERVIDAIASGMSRRRASVVFKISPSTAIRWVREFKDTGQRAAKSTGGDRRSRALEAHKDWLLAVIVTQPDLTLREIRARLAVEKNAATSTSALDRFFGRHRIGFKKKPARRRAGPRGRRPGAHEMAGRAAGD